MNDEFEVIKHPRIKYMNPFLVHLSYRNSHLHNDFEICLLLDGELTVNSKRESYHLTKHSMILFNPIQPHELRASHGSALILSLQVSAKFCSSYFPALPNVVFDLSNLTDGLADEDARSLSSLLVEIAHVYFEQKPAYEMACASLLNQLFYELLQKVPYHLISEEERAKNTQRLHRMNRILSYIEENYAGKLLLSTIAEQEKLSLSYLSHFFKENLNMTFQEYLNQVRFEKARQLVAQTDRRLIDICLESGFSDTRYLNSMFVKQIGCTPKQYRDNKASWDRHGTTSHMQSGQRFYSETESLQLMNKIKQTFMEKDSVEPASIIPR
ncbi:helix-turn-helix domain-containing protein [Paenibacillus sp. NPDC058071]|uniref:helix-turn-helix transcriptional regulator n=1 Tax=Paenibacillus sp. NPDC058071 TaxID=3346326 RepID=UPI0036DB27FB